MNRPRNADIDPMVPELTAATYRTDGGNADASVTVLREAAEIDAPTVPDLS